MLSDLRSRLFDLTKAAGRLEDLTRDRERSKLLPTAELAALYLLVDRLTRKLDKHADAWSGRLPFTDDG